LSKNFSHQKIARRAVFLDGDHLRSLLWEELGSSRKDRHLKALRLAFAASLVVRFGGVAICVSIGPYSEDHHRVNVE
jgi:sulfate adenylyltransferase